MKKLITVTGLNHYFGYSPFKVGKKVKLIKEPENAHDKEAIRVELKGLGKVGYVANSTYTVLGECMSAGRVYDKIGDITKAKIKYIVPGGIICKIIEDKPEVDETATSETNAEQKPMPRLPDCYYR